MLKMRCAVFVVAAVCLFTSTDYSFAEVQHASGCDDVDCGTNADNVECCQSQGGANGGAENPSGAEDPHDEGSGRHQPTKSSDAEQSVPHRKASGTSHVLALAKEELKTWDSQRGGLRAESPGTSCQRRSLSTSKAWAKCPMSVLGEADVPAWETAWECIPESPGSTTCCWPAGRTGGNNDGLGQWYIHQNADVPEAPCRWKKQYCEANVGYSDNCDQRSCRVGFELPCNLLTSAPSKTGTMRLMDGNWTDACLSAFLSESAEFDIANAGSIPAIRRTWLQLRKVYCTPECGYRPPADTVIITNSACSSLARGIHVPKAVDERQSGTEEGKGKAGKGTDLLTIADLITDITQ